MCLRGFFKSTITSLEELLPLLSRKIQTLSFAGISRKRWFDFLTKNNISGNDLVVPIGKALYFH